MRHRRPQMNTKRRVFVRGSITSAFTYFYFDQRKESPHNSSQIKKYSNDVSNQGGGGEKGETSISAKA